MLKSFRRTFWRGCKFFICLCIHNTKTSVTTTEKEHWQYDPREPDKRKSQHKTLRRFTFFRRKSIRRGKHGKYGT